jgi:hypothetical protein
MKGTVGSAAAIGFLALPLLASPALAQGTISTVSPSSAVQGTSNLTVSFTLTAPPPVPPAGIAPASVAIGSLAGVSVTHSAQYVVTAVFTIPLPTPAGAKDCTVSFSTPNGTITFTKTGGFTVTAAPNTPPSIVQHPQSQLVSAGDSVTFAVAASGSAPLEYRWRKDAADIPGADGEAFTIGSATPDDAGSYRCVVTNDHGTATSDAAALAVDTSVQVVKASYPVVDTAQSSCYDAATAIACPSPGHAFYGQDAQIQGYPPRLTRSADGLTVYDQVTRLTWQHTPDTNADGTINASDKMTWAQAQERPAALNAARYGGFDDWRLPTIKDLYSLIDFRGTDPSGLSGTDTSELTPYVDRTYFDFAYGDTSAGERIIDSQYASSNLYAASGNKLFGVNFADGRIKGYDLTMPGGATKTFFVQCVRGNPAYGVNAFVDNGDETVTDRATGLMWPKSDSGTPMSWQDGLAWVQGKNAANHLGYSDWRLPNAKELQSLLDYTRSPDTSGSAAIDPVFQATSFTGETCSAEYPWYWASTTHGQYNGSGAAAAYVCFGRSTGYMSGWVDVHGAGSQRSDPKSGSLGNYSYAACGYYNGIAPQGDSIRIDNYVRLVRGGAGPLRAGFTHVPETPTGATPVTFTASGSGGTSPYSYAWDLHGTPATGASPAMTFAPGEHTIDLTVTDAAGLVTTLTRTLSVSSTATATPPVPDGKLAGAAATFGRSAVVPGQIDVTFDAGTCSSQRAVILYGSLGDFSSYQGCAQSDAGSSGTSAIDASGLGNVWFNIVGTSGTTAGHPGFGFDGTSDAERTWSAAGACGLTADDRSDATCD